MTTTGTQQYVPAKAAEMGVHGVRSGIRSISNKIKLRKEEREALIAELHQQEHDLCASARTTCANFMQQDHQAIGD